LDAAEAASPRIGYAPRGTAICNDSWYPPDIVIEQNAAECP